MDKESIRQDKELARAAIKGLTAYAEQIAHQGKEDEIQQVRSLVDVLGLYWYYEQNVTTERFEDFDGERWIMPEE